MTQLATIKKLEERYHVHICKEEFMAPFSDTIREKFTVWSADGCPWDNVIGYRSLISMLKEDKASLARLANLGELIANGF